MEFTREQRIVNALILHAYSLEDPGLLHGKMGITLYFYHLGRNTGNDIFSKFAEDLLDHIINSLYTNLPIDFENGITDIGWGVEYLIQSGFIEANADEILEEFDAKIKK